MTDMASNTFVAPSGSTEQTLVSNWYVFIIESLRSWVKGSSGSGFHPRKPQWSLIIEVEVSPWGWSRSCSEEWLCTQS
jgi:hypothetical protein